MQAGFRKARIADKLKFNKSTISREVRRNSFEASYIAMKANELSQVRYKSCRRKKIVIGSIREKVIQLLKEDWSPLLISGRLRKEKVSSISHDTIYNFVAEHKEFSTRLRRYGRRGGGRFIQRKSRQRRHLPIAQRPPIVKTRSRMGDWERDGMHVANYNQLLVCVERRSRYTMLAPIGRGIPKDVTILTAKMLNSLPIKTFTITHDNGPENRDSKNQEWPVYHCDPGKPQQRGTIENTIGLLRQYITRKTPIKSLNQKTLDRIANRLNSRPRRCLDYRTPYEVMFGVKVALAS
jgi:IS30 family transposase